ncbi:hypothetical protein ACQRBN_15850 [Bariatricus sp. SGI.154]|uniref:hypothetical protein n=1 Tax=Bariatricus sp. SGI.154 TaxID=3420549 RepID=UPI003D0046CC
MRKRGLLAVLLVVVMTVLCGCGGMSTEDAQSYAKSVLDASYKGEFAKYMEWTKSSEEEAKELYEGNIDVTMKEAGFSDLGLSEEMTENYRQLFLDMIKLAKYDVGEAKEASDDAFTIDVTVEPFIAFEGLQDEVNTAVTEELTNVEQIPSDEEINQMVFQKMYELMAERIAAPVYGDPTTVTITVKPDADNVYYIAQEDMTALDDALFPADKF